MLPWKVTRRFFEVLHVVLPPMLDLIFMDDLRGSLAEAAARAPSAVAKNKFLTWKGPSASADVDVSKFDMLLVPALASLAMASSTSWENSPLLFCNVLSASASGCKLVTFTVPI